MSRISHMTRAILAGVSTSALLIATPLVAPSIAPAAAQTSNSISVEFRTAFSPYGSWRTLARWGEVWAPTRVARDWQPYAEGNWVYSDDYGWYWISDSSEAEWGWITYHYGRTAPTNQRTAPTNQRQEGAVPSQQQRKDASKR